MRTLAVCLVAVGLFLHAARSSDIVETALADDDYCGENSDSESSECSLNALQKRIARVESASESESREGGAGTAGAVTGHPLIHLELYRAIRKKDLSHEFANVDMGTVAGIMNYLHSDVVGEHVGDYGGYEPQIGTKERINGVDTIAGLRAHVRNPDSVIDAVGHHVDFALSAHFIDGEATGPAYNWNFGDIVGVQDGEDHRWPFESPYYRFSMSGFCPNLKWHQKRHGAYAALKKFQQEEHSPSSSGRRRRRDRGLCMMYSEQHDLPYGQVLRGGLCPNGTQPGVMPTGYAGCVYTYEPQSMVSLDELVGITKENCGNRKCKNWQDWRRHCSVSQYRRKFNYQYRRRYSKLRRTKTCVEYDIHKACAKSCSSAACQRIPPNRREVGLPFWKGRCSSLKNAQRVERLATALGIYTAGTKHQLLKAPPGGTCLSATSTLCKPNVTSGGPYCSRLWGGVCQACHIPGTLAPFQDSGSVTTQPCPWDVFRTSGDYQNPLAQPKCASNLPRDLCCLYTSTCNTTLASPLNTTEDSFAYVSAMQDNDAMVALLLKAARELPGVEVTDVDRLSKLAYWQWGLSPLAGKTLKSTMRMIEHYFK